MPFLVIAVLLLAGCGTVQDVCFVQPIGHTDSGVAAFSYHCEPA